MAWVIGNPLLARFGHDSVAGICPLRRRSATHIRKLWHRADLPDFQRIRTDDGTLATLSAVHKKVQGGLCVEVAR